MRDRKEVITVDANQIANHYIDEQGPGAGCLVQFIDDDGTAYVVGDGRVNSETGTKQLQSSFGGFVPDRNIKLKDLLQDKVNFETRDVFKGLLAKAEFLPGAFLHNNVAWEMSYLTGVAKVSLGLSVLKTLVEKVNGLLAKVDRTKVPEKFLKKFNFGIYKLDDLVSHAKVTHQLPEENKPSKAVLNHLTAEPEDIIVFDDMALAGLAHAWELQQAERAQPSHTEAAEEPRITLTCS